MSFGGTETHIQYATINKWQRKYLNIITFNIYIISNVLNAFRLITTLNIECVGWSLGRWIFEIDQYRTARNVLATLQKPNIIYRNCKSQLSKNKNKSRRMMIYLFGSVDIGHNHNFLILFKNNLIYPSRWTFVSSR